VISPRRVGSGGVNGGTGPARTRRPAARSAFRHWLVAIRYSQVRSDDRPAYPGSPRQAASPALATALACHQAWTSQHLGQAMTRIAGDITCDAPGARICGARAYRDFPGRFMTQLTGVQTLAAFGDDSTAVLFYYPHTAHASDAPAAECFTVAGGKITRSVLVCDRPSFAPPHR